MDNETLARIERQRIELEENVSRLRKTLRHWQTLEIDYEGLKEEFQLLPEDTPYEGCLQAARDFKPVIVDDQELQSLLSDQKNGHKSPSQLAEILSKRVDYVNRNVSTVRKQLSDIEKKRNALLLAQDPQHQDEAGLPLSEITEELDDDGTIVSSRVQTPGKDAPDLLEVLRKAGVPDIKEGKTKDVSADDSRGSTNSSKIIEETPPSRPDTTPSSSIPLQDRIEDLSDNDGSTPEGHHLGPTNPDDNEEAAALRQEMLQYGLDEVGTIVAELDLADSGDYSDEENDDDYVSDYDEDEDLYTDESEDEKGATKNPIISERYKREMEALSRKHGISDIKNVGPKPELTDDLKEQLDRPPAAEAARQAAIARAEATRSVLKPTEIENQATSEPKAKKKKVAFAPSLDIATETPKTQTALQTEPDIHPVGDTIIERTTSEDAKAATPSTDPSTPKKVSRFKAARSAAPPTPMFPPPMDFPSSSAQKPTPEGPPGKIIASQLVERPASEVSTPADPIDFDEEMHRREVAIEIQKLRSRKIHAQGGYVRGGEQENYGEDVSPPVLIDENTGKPRKISRFKAARLQSES